jgi:hypothetical protein
MAGWHSTKGGDLILFVNSKDGKTSVKVDIQYFR